MIFQGLNKFVKEHFKSQNSKFVFLLLITFLSFTIPSKSQWAILLRDADSLILSGSDNIYNLEFEKADEKFKEVQKSIYASCCYFLDAMVEW